MIDALPKLAAMGSWLKGQPQTRVIGERTSCSNCPISLWLQEVFGAAVVVDDETIAVQDRNDTHCWYVFATPEEYRRYIDYIDYGSGMQRQEVCVSEARVTLGQVLKEAREEMVSMEGMKEA